MTVTSVGGFPTIFLVKAYKSSVLFFVTCLHVLAKLLLESRFRGKDSSVVPVLRTQEVLDKYLWSRWMDLHKCMRWNLPVTYISNLYVLLLFRRIPNYFSLYFLQIDDRVDRQMRDDGQIDRYIDKGRWKGARDGPQSLAIEWIHDGLMAAWMDGHMDGCIDG